MQTIKAKQIGKSKKFSVILSLRENAGRFEVTRRRIVKGSRDVVLSRNETLEAAEASFSAMESHFNYWAQCITESYAQRIEAGDFVTVEAR